MTVVRVDVDMVTVRNESGKTWSIGDSIVEAECHDTTTVNKEFKVTIRQMEAMFRHVRDAVCSVTFTKALDLKAVAEKVVQWNQDSDGGDIVNYRKVRRQVTDWVKGETRTLRGYMKEQMDDGRWRVVDMDVDADAPGGNERLVDPRTTTELVLRGIKYTLKKR